jgi:hypothetical protein
MHQNTNGTALSYFQGHQLTKNQATKCIKAKSVQQEHFSTHNTKLPGLRRKGKDKVVTFTPQMPVVDWRYSATSSNPETRWR